MKSEVDWLLPCRIENVVDALPRVFLVVLYRIDILHWVSIVKTGHSGRVLLLPLHEIVLYVLCLQPIRDVSLRLRWFYLLLALTLFTSKVYVMVLIFFLCPRGSLFLEIFSTVRTYLLLLTHWMILLFVNRCWPFLARAWSCRNICEPLLDSLLTAMLLRWQRGSLGLVRAFSVLVHVSIVEVWSTWGLIGWINGL